MRPCQFIARLCVAASLLVIGCADSDEPPEIETDAGLPTDCGSSCAEGQSCDIVGGSITCLPSCVEGLQWDPDALECVTPSEPPPACDDCESDSLCEEAACDDSGVCVTTPVDCDDADACTVDACDPETGCTSVPLECDDGDACTVESCDPEAGCSYEEVVCPDLDLCNVGVCDPETGCGFAPRVCDDGDPCTDDVCDPVEGCVATPIDCPDQNACSVGICVPGEGCAFEPLRCDDGNPCTRDACDPASGCFSSSEECDDGTPCEVGVCEPGVGCSYVARNCDDADPCTVDRCESAFGCTNEPVACTPSSVCFVSATCDPDTGACVNASPNTDVCDDGLRCTAGDTCDGAGVCVGGPALSCTEETPCPQTIAFFADRPLIGSNPVTRIEPFDPDTGERLSAGADPGSGLAATIYTHLDGEDSFDVATGGSLPADTVGEPRVIVTDPGALPGIEGIAAISLRGFTLDQDQPTDYFVDPAAPGDEIRIYRGGEITLWAYDASGSTYSLAALYTNATMTLTVTWSAGRIVGFTRGELTEGSRAYPFDTIEASITGFVECAARTSETGECYGTYTAGAAATIDLCTAPACLDFVCNEETADCLVESIPCD